MRACARVHCTAAARAGVVVDSDHQHIAIIDLDAEQPFVIGLCHRHADRLTMPAGWKISERREAQQSLFNLEPEPVVAADAVGVTPIEHQRARRILDAEDVPGDVAVAGPRPTRWIGEPAARSNELLDVDDDSPLLARAFRASQAS